MRDRTSIAQYNYSSTILSTTYTAYTNSPRYPAIRPARIRTCAVGSLKAGSTMATTAPKTLLTPCICTHFLKNARSTCVGGLGSCIYANLISKYAGNQVKILVINKYTYGSADNGCERNRLLHLPAYPCLRKLPLLPVASRPWSWSLSWSRRLSLLNTVVLHGLWGV